MNYNHLYYFWVIHEEGGLAKAARKLGLTHSTLSTQLHNLEQFLGSPLFDRRGGRLVVTPLGSEIAAYSADIFRLGEEMVQVAREQKGSSRSLLRVGVVETLPKTLTYQLLEPALDANGDGLVQVHQDSLASLLEALAAGRLHLILADEAPAERHTLRIHAHVLGETEILLFGVPKLAAAYRDDFPASLGGAPFVLPPTGTTLRRRIDQWLTDNELLVDVVAEVDDAGLLRVFGGAGRGLFPVRGALRAEVEDLHRVAYIGTCTGLRERYFALSTERRVRHPAVAALIQAARTRLHPAGAKRG